jgi:NFACT protein C-terminal domain
VKLTPGGMKRGKASKQCLDTFLKPDGIKASIGGEKFRDLIKKVGDNDWVQVLCNDVKISAPGASKATKKKQSAVSKSKKK